MTETNPYRVSTHDLGRRPGSMRTVELDVVVTEPMGNEVIVVPAGAEISLDLRLEAVMDGVLVTGSATATAQGECVRCLDPVSRDLTLDVTELFAYPGTQQDTVRDEDDEELPELDGEIADLETTITDAVVLALPFQPLCRPDCPGLCSVCGIRLADAEPGHAHEQLDPRWAALSALRDVVGAADDAQDDGEQDSGSTGAPGTGGRG
ncbi:YceD family protein [Ruania albidiflava]|uniref:YceD family protein n=1 Tax=Ruania albidiflava TaxID=366586 RepID=UPI0003B69D43|nr:DUF177 domain-containing protein [Ruania albidiflava]